MCDREQLGAAVVRRGEQFERAAAVGPGYGTNSPTVGMSGNASERVAVVTAKARTLPVLPSFQRDNLRRHVARRGRDQDGSPALVRLEQSAIGATPTRRGSLKMGQDLL